MLKFACPVAMKVTQFQCDFIAMKLRNIGYDCKQSPYIQKGVEYIGTCYNGNNNFADSVITPEKHGRYIIDNYNPELFLALAAMVDDKEFHLGEWVYVEDGGYGSRGSNQMFGKIVTKPNRDDFNYKGQGYSTNCPFYIKINEDVWGLGDDYKIRKATKEEIIKLFTNIYTQNIMKKYKIINKKYLNAANEICNASVLYGFDHNSMAYAALKDAGVLHWFEEVKEEIIIEGKTVQFEEDCVIIGCQKILKADLNHVYKSCEIIKKLSENSSKNIAIGDGKLMINVTDYSKEFKQIIDKIK